MRKCWNCGQPTDDDNSRVCSDEICQRAEKKSTNGEFKHRAMVEYYERVVERQRSPEYKAKKREYYARPENKARMREYQQRPEAKAKAREYYARPEVKAKKREYMREYMRERSQRKKKLREEE